MKITYKQLKAAQAALFKVLNADLELDVSLGMRRLAKRVDPEFQVYEDERKKLLTKYGQKNEKGDLIEDKDRNIVFETTEHLTQFQTDLKALEEQPIEVPEKCIDLKKLKGIKCSTFDLVALEPFLIED